MGKYYYSIQRERESPRANVSLYTLHGPFCVCACPHREREGLTGIARKEEVVHQTMGEDVDIFDRDATAFEEEGTKENPIVILSNESSRIVGISLPVSLSRLTR